MARDVSDETKAKWRRVLTGLRIATDSKKISWDRTAVESAFITSLGIHVILLEKQEDDSSNKYTVKLQDQSGELVDEFDDEDLDAGLFDNEHYAKLSNLYLKIRRQISGADSAIDDVLVELDKLDEIPF